MRGFGQLLACDIRYGIANALARLTLLCVVAAIALFISWVKLYLRFPEGASGLTLGEGIFLVWYGMLPYNPGDGDPFQFPMAWFCLLIAITFAVSDYPSRDIEGIGAAVVVRSGSRWAWWLSKCVWTALMGLIAIGMTVALALITVLFGQGGLVLTVRPCIAGVLDAGFNYEIQDAVRLIQTGQAASAAAMVPSFDISHALVACAVCLVALLQIQLVLSVHLHPVLGMAANIAILFLSTYFFNPWLPGEYMLLARTDVMLDGGLSPCTGILLGVGVSAAAVVVGGVVFKYTDIMGKRGENR